MEYKLFNYQNQAVAELMNSSASLIESRNKNGQYILLEAITGAGKTVISSDYIEKALVAISEDGNYQVEFYQLADEEGACTFYLENYNILAGHESDAVSHVESSTKSTQNYEITGKEGYGCISRIGNTCFYSVADKDYKKEVKDFKKEFGY